MRDLLRMNFWGRPVDRRRVIATERRSPLWRVTAGLRRRAGIDDVKDGEGGQKSSELDDRVPRCARYPFPGSVISTSRDSPFVEDPLPGCYPRMALGHLLYLLNSDRLSTSLAGGYTVD